MDERQAKLRRARPGHEPLFEFEPIMARQMNEQRDGHAGAQSKLTFDMAAMGIKPPDCPGSELVLLVQDDGARNGKGFRSSEEKQVCMA
jgi:hypothetical protein